MLHKLLAIIIVLSTTAFPIEFQIHGYVPKNLYINSLEKEYERICKLLQLQDSITHTPVFINFYKRSEASVLGIRLPEWGGGGALGTDSIFIPVDVSYAFYQSDYQQILTHELVHIIISRKYGTIRIPRWFHEGMAMALSGEIDSDAQIIMSKAILTGKLLSLDSVRYVNRFKKDRARIAYCQSHFAVLFLMQKYGQDLLPELISEIKQRYSFDVACTNVFGLTSKEIDSIVRKEIKSRYHLLFLFDEVFLWFLILILAIVGFVATLYRKKQRQKQLELDEVKMEDGKVDNISNSSDVAPF